jgi:Tol biopolymer transport system component
MPSFLPDGRRFVFHVVGEPEAAGIYLGSLDGGAPKRLIAASLGAKYLPPDSLIFVQGEAIVVSKLDAERGELTGDPIKIAPGRGGQTAVSVSSGGIVAYRTSSGAVGRLTWFGSDGIVLERGGDTNAPELSPNERYIAYDRTVNGNRDVWIQDLDRDSLVPFTRHPAVDGFPVWSPDESRLAFHSQRTGNFDIWVKPFNEASGEELLLGTPDNEWPIHWSKDGRFLLYQRSDKNYESADLWALPMTGAGTTPIAVANTPFEERMGEFSPDGNWVVYETEEFGRAEIVARSFPASRGILHVSTNGGTAPRWSWDGKTIYFIAPDGKLMAVPVSLSGSTLSPGKPRPLFSTQIADQPFKFQYDVSRDGRFLVNNRFIAESANSPITLILNWRHPND